MDRVVDFVTLARAADPNVSGLAVLGDRAAEAGWTVVTRADGVRVRIDTANGAAPLQAAVNAVLNADLSASAVQAREDAAFPERAAVRNQVVSAVAANNAFLAIANPTAAQVRDQTLALTRQMNAVLKRLAQIN